ncbi:MAG: RNA 2',3'-cyclic phosphodiesterase [Gammaproteobacteria bacterium]|nr:RNA 2',3'-cyclic phosphodiesterase [Gammaproteobacteria bacterium]
MSEPGPASETTVRRLFFALWPDEALRSRLYRLGADLLDDNRGRRLPAENLHLTLAFLGYVDTERQACLEREASIMLPAFTLVLDRAGFWPHKGVLWVGGTPPEGLQALVWELNQGLNTCGIEPETRPFQVHLTLARNVHHLRLGRDHAIAPLTWKVSQFALVASQTLPTGARYEVLRTWRLG